MGNNSTLISVNIKTNPYFLKQGSYRQMDAATRELSQRNTGKLIDKSCEVGLVQFTYEVEDAVVAKAKAILVVAKRFPGHSYTVDVLTPKNIRDLQPNNSVTHEVTSRYEFDHKRDFGIGM